ncbi:type VI secretion system ATPase TssH [Azovibrio restrictus]|uniref:type VI secretion system ATPase TssH n=2 Tax=Azovibrio restrictus TaxID=146938 RepID=UPI000402DD75|nr:type VI secretion system ATPase TssH [Azovibrio restrictus]
MTLNLKSLIGKLDAPARRAMESAANRALARTHHEIDIEHVLLELLDSPSGELLAILKHYRVDTDRLHTDLSTSLDSFRTGNTRNPVLSHNILRWLEAAWLAASVNHGAQQLGGAYLLLALSCDEELKRLLGSSCAALKRIPPDDLRDNLPALLQAHANGADAGPEEASRSTPQAKRASPNLDKYTIDLTSLARAGKIDPVLGRDGEIRQMIDILMRRRQNNPILTGEPGVGKTAVVEGLALRIVQDDVPEVLRNINLRTLDLGLLQAGASVKGEFENRLRSVMDEVKASLQPIILFIDEAHTLIGAGGQAGQNDAANLLKPALARGELRTIAATTWSEYKKYFEKDAALARRFQLVKIEEPPEDAAIQMVRGVADAMETHHKVRILDAAVVEAVKLSSRYISGRQLPDKAISVLDTACARVALSRNSKPAVVEDVERLIQNLERETAALQKEQDPAHDKRLKELAAQRKLLEKDLEHHQAGMETQRRIVDEITALRAQLAEQPPATGRKGKTPASREASLHEQLLACQHQLQELHQQQALIYECVDGATIAEVISAWTGIPLGGMVADEVDTVRKLRPLLEQRVVGQSHALELIARRIQVAKASLEDPGKPKGVFLLVGPSGVGKTETALALADTLYGGERNLITINMSEYQEAHSVSGLKGSPPGYVGYGEGGVLTEAVRRRPYSVVLLDEVEKAHPDVLELFFQVFDKGTLEDAEGREVDFKNTIIILTSNVGSELVMQAVEHGVTVAGEQRQPTPADLVDLLRPSLQRSFKPAFLGRLAVVPYYPISDEIMALIVGLKLEKVKQRLLLNHGAKLNYDKALVEQIVSRCSEVDSGARDAEAIITDTVLPLISEQILARMAEGQGIERVDLKVRKDELQVLVK